MLNSGNHEASAARSPPSPCAPSSSGSPAGAGAVASPAGPRPAHAADQFAMKPDGSSGADEAGAAIPNIDSVKATIRTYYGATSDGIADKKKSPYITEIAKILTDQNAYLAQNAKARQARPSCSTPTTRRCGTTTWRTGRCTSTSTRRSRTPGSRSRSSRPCPAWSTSSTRPPKLGYTVFGLTGRNDDQEPATLANLTKVGYGTIHRRQVLHQVDRQAGQQPAAVVHHLRHGEVHDRRVQGRHPQVHRERRGRGYNIVLNVGDQWSDLQGGSRRQGAQAAQPDVLPAEPEPAGAARAEPSSRATSSPWSPTARAARPSRGEGIPNFDSVKATIRAYYNAPGRHREQALVALHHRDEGAARQVGAAPEGRAAPTRRPSATGRPSSSTPTTRRCGPTTWRTRRWHFNFDPALQDVWVQDQKFPAVPGMKRVVKAAKNAGCKVIGLTGRERRPAQGDAEEPAQVLRRRVPVEVLLHQVGRRAAAGVRHLRGRPTSAPAWSSSRRRGPTPRRSSG